MGTKLTLRLEEDLIRRAKRYSQRHGKSLSKLVADYFAVLDGGAEPAARHLPPVTRSLKGAAAGQRIKLEDYRQHLRSKHLGE
jgi:replicative DNA helicase